MRFRASRAAIRGFSCNDKRINGGIVSGELGASFGGLFLGAPAQRAYFSQHKLQSEARFARFAAGRRPFTALNL
jgi:hypothetical protein